MLCAVKAVVKLIDCETASAVATVDAYGTLPKLDRHDRVPQCYLEAASRAPPLPLLHPTGFDKSLLCNSRGKSSSTKVLACSTDDQHLLRAAHSPTFSCILRQTRDGK